MKRETHWFKAGILGLTLLQNGVALAGEWDDKVTAWRRESAGVTAARLPQLEAQARQGDARAAYLLYLEANLPRHGYGQQAGAGELGRWATWLAEAGNPVGMRMLCYLHAEGKGGLAKDADAAIRWCERGAALGFGDAMRGLGGMHRHGLLKDDAKAVDWYRKGAEAGSALSMVDLGVMHQHGLGGVSKDEARAVEWYRKGAEAGSAVGMSNLGRMYRDGKGGLAKDDARAAEWFRKGAEAGDGGAMAELGWMHENGKGGLVKDEARAVEWYRKGAEAGNGAAMLNLGWAYEYGELGLARNLTDARMWIEKSAEAGHARGVVNLGRWYRDGMGDLPRDEARAVELFRKGAEANDSVGLVSLGKMHERGRGGLSRDYAKARALYRQALDLGGYAYAKVAMGELHDFAYGVSQDFAEARKWYLEGAKEGEQVAAVHLARHYRKGLGVPVDPNQAAHWLARSLQGKSTAVFHDTGESGAQRGRRELDDLLSQGLITDPEVLRQVKGISQPAPRLAWARVANSTDAEEVEFAYRVEDAGGGVGDTRILVDGVAYNPGAGRNVSLVESGGAKRMEKSFSLRLPAGRHEIAVQAYNAENLINFSEIRHRIESSYKPVRKPRLHAVVVGIDEYGNAALTLRYARNDAGAVARILKEKGGRLFDGAEITLLDRKETTGKRAILQALRDAAGKVQAEDVFVFYVAGHGQIDESNAYRMLTADVRLLSDSRMRDDSIGAEELQKAIYDIPSAKKLILLDTCHSGQGLKAESLLGKRGGLEDLEAIKRINRKSGAVVMAASESKEQALEGYQGHGIFTYALLEALEGKADVDGDRLVSTRELQEYVEVRASELAEKLFKARQSPYPSAIGQGFPVVSVR